MSREPNRRFDARPPAGPSRRWWCLALALATAGSTWACTASRHGPRPAAATAATASTDESWWWFTDDAFHAPSPAEEQWLLGFARRERGGEADVPEVEIEKPSGTNISCPCDVSIHFRPGRNPGDPSRVVPIDLRTVKIMAERLGVFHVTKDLTSAMEPFREDGFSRAGVQVPSGRYRISIEIRDQLGRTARNQAYFSVENR